jgi:DNA-binding transcriptional LysR family regulator
MACLGQMRYCLVASRDSELGRMKGVTVEELARHRQIIVEDSYRQNFTLNGQSWVVNDMLIAVYWASLGIGWTAIPYGLARSVMEDREDTKLVVLDLQGVENFEVNIYMVWNTAFARPDILEFLQSDLMQRYRAVLRESHSGFTL